MKNTALNIAGTIFLIMAILQLIRVMVKAKVMINDRIVIPLWMSKIASPVLFLLSAFMFIAAG